ncbi:MAG: radical SAM protein, partial [Terriglobia bacterium]
MRLSSDQALDMLASDDLLGLGMEADAVRRRLHPGGVITYQIDRNINYTNFCTEYCSFCAFYRPAGSPEGYLQTLESIFQKIDETMALGGTGVLMQGGLHPTLKIDYYVNLLSSIKKR